MNGLNGHGHVVPNPDGSRARCGGPALCNTCAGELSRQEQQHRPSLDAFVDPTNTDAVSVIAQAIREADMGPWYSTHLIPAETYARVALTAIRQHVA